MTTMTTRCALVLILGLGLLPLGGAQTDTTEKKPADDAFKVTYTVEVGGETRITDSQERWSKFVQFRDIPRNFTVNSLKFEMGRANSPWSFRGWATDATQLDQRYRLELEKFGRSRTQFRYSSMPWFVSRLTQPPYTYQGNGVFTFPDLTQQALQAGTTVTIPPIVNDTILNTPNHDLRLRREQFWVREDLTITNHWSTFAEFSRQQRRGFRPLGLGVYERGGTPTGGFFTLKGDELPEPVDHAITELRAGLAYHTRRALVRFEYTGSWFQNDVSTLIWDNPWQFTDTEANPGGGTGRWRFSRGQLDLYPDNRAHTFSFLARFSLPYETFVSALLAYSMRRQDDPFLPYTLNTAVVTGVPLGVVPTDASTLPRQSLGGEVNTITGDVAVGTRHWKKFLVTTHYRAYNYSNQTPELDLPGYVVQDAFWNATVDGVPLGEVQQINSFLRQQASVEFAWRPNRQFQWKLEPTWEGWNRDERSAPRTNEFGGKTQIIVDPAKWFNARLNWRYGNRRYTSYTSPEFEFQGLTTIPPGVFASGIRTFDQANRVHHDGGLVLNFVDKNGKWGVSANYNYNADNYQQIWYGLQDYRTGSAGVDVNYNPTDTVGFFSYYTHQRTRYDYRTIAKGGAGATKWILENEWDRNTRDALNSFGVGVNLAAAKQKWLTSLTYDFSLVNTRTNTFNPSTPTANAINDALAHPFPDVDSDFHELRLDTSYRFRPRLTGGVRYMFSPFRLDDFALDIMQPYFGGTTGIVDTTTNEWTRALFLNSRYGSFDAHSVGVYLRYSF